MKRIVLITLMAAAYCVVACKKAQSEAAAPAASTAPAKPQVIIKGSTGKSVERSFPRFLRVTGQLTAQSDAVVAADAVGRVVTAPIERGTAVKAGDILATLDERQAKLSVAEADASAALAKSRLALAKNEQERNKPLAEKKAVADADYQKLLTEVAAREAELAAAGARLDQAQKILDDSVIRAPFGGVVAERMVEPGEYVRQDSSVARVVDVATLRLVLSVPETEVGGLKIGQTVEFTTAAFPNQLFNGKLKFLGTSMREASRDLIIEAAVDNADGKLRPGFFCNARIQMRVENAVAVPEKALRIDGNRRRVFVIAEDKTLSERLVEVGEIREGFVEIRRGISKDETLLMEPSADAADGLPFQPAA
jgi:RND family efflux transporter MFP subunit